MIVDELVTILGLDIAASALPNIMKFNKQLDSVIKYAEGVAAAVAVTGAAIVAFAERMSDSAADLDKFSQLTGMSVAGIQKWSYAVEQAGGDARAAKGDIMMLTKALNPIMPGDFNQGLFLLLGPQGLKNVKNAEQALIAVAERMQGMSPQKKAQWASMIGLSPDMLLLLGQGEKAIHDYFHKIEAEGGLITDKQAKQARKFQQEWNNLKTVLYKTGENIATSLMPGVNKLLGLFDRWVTKNQDFIKSGLDRFIKGVGDGFSRFADVVSTIYQHLPILTKLFDLMMDPRIIGGAVFTALTGVAAVLGLIATKYAIIGAAIMAVIAATEDVASSFAKDEKGRIGTSGKDTLLNRGLDWMHDHLPNWLRTPDNEWKRAGSAPGTSFAADMLPRFKELFDVATGKMVPAPPSYNVNRDYLERQTKGDVTVNNNVTVNGTGDTFATGQEVVHQLQRFTVNSMVPAVQ